MRALVATGTRELVAVAEVDDPRRGSGDVLVAVRAVSVNRGELHRLLAAPAGWRPGWDFAGTVVGRSAAGPPVGARVLGFRDGGAWAERVGVPAPNLAVIPDQVADGTAAAIPVAGVTAVRLLRLGGALAGRQVLVTGAAGGVGRFAVQLARRQDATVTAVVGRADRAAGLARLGAARVVEGIDSAEGLYDLILESVGGASLARAFELVAQEGTIVTFGNSSHRDARLPVASFYPKQARLLGYFFPDDVRQRPLAPDLAELAELVARGDLEVEIGASAGWEEAPRILRALQRRGIRGKAVLHVAHGTPASAARAAR